MGRFFLATAAGRFLSYWFIFCFAVSAAIPYQLLADESYENGYETYFSDSDPSLSSNWDSSDDDGDGLSNSDELNQGTDPYSEDSDNDGVNDGAEVYGVEITLLSTGEFGAETWTEFVTLDPLNSDFDGDGAWDGWELEWGSDPTTAEAHDEQLLAAMLALAEGGVEDGQAAESGEGSIPPTVSGGGGTAATMTSGTEASEPNSIPDLGEQDGAEVPAPGSYDNDPVRADGEASENGVWQLPTRDGNPYHWVAQVASWEHKGRVRMEAAWDGRDDSDDSEDPSLRSPFAEILDDPIGGQAPDEAIQLLDDSSPDSTGNLCPCCAAKAASAGNVGMGRRKIDNPPVQTPGEDGASGSPSGQPEQIEVDPEILQRFNELYWEIPEAFANDFWTTHFAPHGYWNPANLEAARHHTAAGNESAAEEALDADFPITRVATEAEIAIHLRVLYGFGQTQAEEITSLLVHGDPSTIEQAGGDSDGDGIRDWLESFLLLSPQHADSDADGIDDLAELTQWLTHPADLDTDGERGGEVVERTESGTNPRAFDLPEEKPETPENELPETPLEGVILPDDGDGEEGCDCGCSCWDESDYSDSYYFDYTDPSYTDPASSCCCLPFTGPPAPETAGGPSDGDSIPDGTDTDTSADSAGENEGGDPTETIPEQNPEVEPYEPYDPDAEEPEVEEAPEDDSSPPGITIAPPETLADFDRLLAPLKEALEQMDAAYGALFKDFVETVPGGIDGQDWLKHIHSLKSRGLEGQTPEEMLALAILGETEKLSAQRFAVSGAVRELERRRYDFLHSPPIDNPAFRQALSENLSAGLAAVVFLDEKVDPVLRGIVAEMDPTGLLEVGLVSEEMAENPYYLRARQGTMAVQAVATAGTSVAVKQGRKGVLNAIGDIMEEGGEEVAGRAGSRATRQVEIPNSITRRLDSSNFGEKLGRGGNKDVYAYGDDKAVGVLHSGRPASAIDDEISMLNQLKERGLPTVNAQRIEIDGQPAILMDRFAQGSKDVVKLERGKVRIVGDSPLLNDQSVRDLQRIRSTMTTNQVKIDDLQFLIGNDGRVVIADPLNVVNSPPSRNNLRTIDLLIEAARKNAD